MPSSPWITQEDIYLFSEGTHARLYQRLGAHSRIVDGVQGTQFAVWAPNASEVSVLGDFNGWKRTANPLTRGRTGIWEGFVPGVSRGTVYKYFVRSRINNYDVEKADPFAFFAETPPKTASMVWDLDYEWQDSDWMACRASRISTDAPVSIYELHLGSWRRLAAQGNRWMTYREIAPELADYVTKAGFTHVELLPLMEHPFYGSWGYQITSYFGATSRYGTPQDLMYLVDYLHQRGIGVILDWVPSHFPDDQHGLAFFDGTNLFEHEDPRKRLHPEWKSLIFNYGRNEVRSFLYSSALFWLDKYHADGLRVDAVASMLYLDYGRKAGDWVPNKFGGRENLDTVDFLRQLNQFVYREFPGVQTIAEESTSWPMVSRPVNVGGLGFGYKWDMGWMNDSLRYLARDPVFRKYHHRELNFRRLYAFSENFVLPLSHDEVVHGKSSLLSKMPGDDWRKFANLRLLLGYQYAQSGKKLLFMGGEFGQRREWDHDGAVEWALLQYAPHHGLFRWVSDLNTLYKQESAMHQLDCEPSGFEWIDADDSENSVLSFIRKDRSGGSIVIVCNFTPVPREGYLVGVSKSGWYRELLNSDAECYGGSGWGNLGGIESGSSPMHGRPNSLKLNLPPLAVIFLKCENRS
ncbi:MAG: 1,4-alpha-glucan branching protein GlgB [Dehalogenimonas sp.]